MTKASPELNLPSPILLVSCDTSGVEVADMPISVAAALVKYLADGTWRELGHWHGLQAPPKGISSEATQIHGLTEADVRGQVFDISPLREMCHQAQAVVAWHPDFNAKMLAKVMPEALDKPWYAFRPHFSEPRNAPAPAGPVRAIACVDEILRWMSTRAGTTTRSKTWLTSILQDGRIPVHAHVAGDLPITLRCGRPAGKVFCGMLSKCAVGTTFRLWTRVGIDYIAAYARGYVNGGGLSFHLPPRAMRIWSKSCCGPETRLQPS